MSEIAILKNLPIRDLMIRKVVSVCISEPFSAVYEKMENHHIRHLPVVDENGQLIGIITQRDLFRAHPPRETEDGWVYNLDELNRLSIKHFMTRDPVTLKPEQTLHDALDIFVRDKYGAIPVITPDKQVAGIVSHSDLLRYFLKAFSS